MEKVTFNVGKEKLVGHYYPAESVTGKAPALVYTGPHTGVKEQVTGTYARRLAEAGFTSLSFDHRNFGESDGDVRQHEEPNKKIEDLAAAIGYLSAREDVDEDRIGAVGICLGGSYALRIAGFDPRIKALANVAAAYIGFPPENPEEAAGKSQWLATFKDELNKSATSSLSRRPAVSETETDVAMPGQEPFDYYGTERSFSPHWKNEMTRLSSYHLACFDSIAAIALLEDTPSLVIHGTTDAFCSPENAERAYNMMTGKKQLNWIETTNHIELYDDMQRVDEAIGLVTDWMKSSLG